MLAAVSRGLGIVIMPPLAHSVLEHVRFLLLPDGRVVVVLISVGGATRDKVLRPEHEFTQSELDRTADYLNRHYKGWTLDVYDKDGWELKIVKTEKVLYVDNYVNEYELIYSRSAVSAGKTALNMFCKDKPGVLRDVAGMVAKHGGNILATRANEKQFAAVKKKVRRAEYRPLARAIVLGTLLGWYLRNPPLWVRASDLPELVKKPLIS
jgi:hypothetical protein